MLFRSVVAPAPGFLEMLREECTAAGALLIFDEVITGFRVARGGAQARFGIRPDVSVFGKVVGGGLPLAVVGGPAEVMDHLAPLGPVYQAGTLSGNPLATAAGLAVLDLLTPDVYDVLERRAAALTTGLHAALDAAGIANTAPRVHTLAGVFLRAEPVRDYDDSEMTEQIDQLFGVASMHVNKDTQTVFNGIMPIIQQMMQQAQQFKPQPPMTPEALVLQQTSMAETQRRANRDQADIQLATQKQQQEMQLKMDALQKDLEVAQQDNATKERIEAARIARDGARLKHDQNRELLQLMNQGASDGYQQ